MASVVLTGLIVFVGGFVGSIKGFGFSVLSVPVLSVAFGPRAAVPLNVLLSLALDGMLLAQC